MAYAQPFPLSFQAAQRQQQQQQKTAHIFGPDLAVRLICPECRDPRPDIVEEFGSGDLVCRNCGLILGDRIVDTRSEWRTFANDEGDDPSRVGAAIDPIMEGMEHLDTVISFRDGGSGIARELQRAASRSQASRSERTLMQAFRDISNWCDQFSLPKTISDIAKQLFKRSDEEKLLRGKSIEAVIAACIFIACRQAHVPRTFREICILTHVPKKTLGQCFKTLEKAFNLANVGDSRQSNNSEPSGKATNPEDLLPRYCNKLALAHNIQSMCSDIIVRGRELGFVGGRSPVSIAGGAILFTADLVGSPTPIKRICDVAGVSEGTVRTIYKLFLENKEAVVKKEWIESGKANLNNVKL